MQYRSVVLVMVSMLLAACSSMRLVDSDVSSFAPPPALVMAQAATFRFDRLPSQQAQAQRSAALEAIAQVALERAGMRRDDAAAQYSVQLGLRMFRDPQAPWDDPRYIQGIAVPAVVPTRYGLLLRHPSLNLQFDFPYYRREVTLVIRRAADAQVVFETRAQHDGRWPDDEGVLPAMFQAALQGFPNPPAGMHRVVVEIPR